MSLGPTRDQLDFPDYADALPGLKGGRPSGPPCTGPVVWRDFAAVEREIANFMAAVATAPPAGEAFLSAVSPCQAARFMPNRYYPSDEEYLHTLAQVLSAEYKAIADAGFNPPTRLPGPRLGLEQPDRHLTIPESARRWRCTSKC